MSQPPVPPPLEYAPPPAKPAARVSRLAIASLALGLLTRPLGAGLYLLAHELGLLGGEADAPFIAILAFIGLGFLTGLVAGVVACAAVARGRRRPLSLWFAVPGLLLNALGLLFALHALGLFYTVAAA